MSFTRRLPFLVLILLIGSIANPVRAAQPAQPHAAPQNTPSHSGTGVRFATFNASLNRNSAGQLIRDLSTPNDTQAKTVAEIIQRTNPDVLLINEFDYYGFNVAANLFQENYLSISQNGASPVEYPYVYVAPSNTGEPSGFDLNNNGFIGGGDDAYGFGLFPGQFGMAVFSKYPIDSPNVRTFQKFLWKDMPGALLPDNPATPAPSDWYSPEELNIFRLSSKSHWDVPIQINGEIVHALVSHPTPPVFDGPEDRNGTRNHDEIRLWADYVTPGVGTYLYDDQGRGGGLALDARFVIMGDQNADPNDGDSVNKAIQQLLDNPYINTTVTPTSQGGPQQSALQGGANASHESDPAYDTADFADTTPGNLRADYVLPSADLRIADARVFWPLNTSPFFPLVGVFTPSLPGGFPSSDHRLVWVDVDVLPSVTPVRETPPVYDLSIKDLPAGARPGDADDPAIWVNPSDSAQSLVIGALKNGGLEVYDLDGNILQSINTTGSVRYNNVDVQYGFLLDGKRIDLAVASDRKNDRLAIFSIDPVSRKLVSVGDPANPLLFAPVSDGTRTAYGLTLYRSPVTDKYYVFVSRRTTDTVAQLELFDNGAGKVGYRQVRTLNTPGADDLQVEGMVADNELGLFYVAQEDVGIWKFAAEPDGSSIGISVDTVYPTGKHLKADAEGLTLYYAADGKGYLLASSQGDSTFAVYERAGSNQYLGNFRIGNGLGGDGVQNSDGATIVNLPFSSEFPNGLLVVHDGANDPAYLVEDDGEIENVSTNFKYVRWEEVAQLFDPPLIIEPLGHNPRDPQPSTLPNGIAAGDVTQNSVVLWARSTVTGALRFDVSSDPSFASVQKSASEIVSNSLQPVRTLITELWPATTYYYRTTDAAGTQLIGTFRTAAALGARTGLHFGVTGDWRGELSPYPAISNAAEHDLDFFVELGDTIYADVGSPAVPASQARTLDEYRRKHAEVYGTRYGLNTWADLRASTAIFATIDDHEVTNDFAGGALCSSDTRFTCPSATTSINDSELYDNGVRAFQEYNPLADESYGNTGDPRTSGEQRLYRYRSFGSDAALFVLDARSFRDTELPDVTNPNDPAQVGAFLAASFDPSRTMLGRQQVADLKRDLLDAQQRNITWKFVVVPEPIQNLGILAASDRFEGYAAERTEILKYVNDQGIKNVVFLSADIHGTLVNNLTYQTGPGRPQIATGVWEITTGSVGYHAPFGPTVIGLAAQLGILSPAQVAFYQSLPRAGKDAFLGNIVDAQLTPLGYTPLGLQDSSIPATLLQGSYIATHVYGWTEFSIDATSGQLRVTTYGIDYYDRAELLANPTEVTNRIPTVVSEFVVNPLP